MSRADISGPEVIRGFRANLHAFAATTAAVLGSHGNDLRRTYDWLRSEQLPHWKRLALRREELYQNARRLWLQAEDEVAASATSRGPGKPSSLEERIDMDKARRLRDEAEEKLALIRRWVARLDHEAGPLIAQCQGHGLDLHERCSKALATLDRLADRLQSYLDLPTSTGAGLPRSAGPGAPSSDPPAPGAAPGGSAP